MAARQVIMTPVKIAYDCDVCGGEVVPNRDQVSITNWCDSLEKETVNHRCVQCQKEYTFNVDISQLLFTDNPNGYTSDAINKYILPNKDKDNE